MTALHRRVGVLGVDDICWQLPPATWPKSRPAVELALDALPSIEDAFARALIITLVTTIVGQDEELAAVRAVSSESLTFSAAQLGQATHARHRLAERLAADRRRSR